VVASATTHRVFRLKFFCHKKAHKTQNGFVLLLPG